MLWENWNYYAHQCRRYLEDFPAVVRKRYFFRQNFGVRSLLTHSIKVYLFPVLEKFASSAESPFSVWFVINKSLFLYYISIYFEFFPHVVSRSIPNQEEHLTIWLRHKAKKLRTSFLFWKETTAHIKKKTKQKTNYNKEQSIAKLRYRQKPLS